MNISTQNFSTIFAKNRTEELGLDVWQHFVVPLFFDKLDFGTARKPRLFIGGRGCGKTMLLRYLSHQSAFSLDRDTIPSDAIEHIGLYWRVDTQFATIMNERGLHADIWHSAFNHLLSIFLGIEILKSLKNIAASKYESFTTNDLSKINFDRFSAFDSTFIGGVDDLLVALETKLWEFEVWVANVRKKKEPTFLPGASFLTALIKEVQTSSLSLKSVLYFVYVDEFENLLPYQQKILNTYLKHSEAPLIFNIAMKRHAFETIQTIGNESIQNIADFRKHDLEEYLLSHHFPLFAAEVLFLNLALGGINDVSIDIPCLRDPNSISVRKDKSYQEKILRQIRDVFPGVSHENLAKNIFENSSLRGKLQDRIEQGIKSKHSQLPLEKFFRPNQPQATIVVPALLFRKRLTPEEILNDLNMLDLNQDNRFTGERGWIHNNFIGCLLWLYEAHSTACPFYAGFDTFCLLARGNLRHFLELCHISLNQVAKNVKTLAIVVPPEIQAKAARQASAHFLNEIPAFGKLGDRLHTFVFRLGSLFALAHRRPTQSEPEQSHFAIVSDNKPLGADDDRFLHEAEKWCVLFQEEETKNKDEFQVASFEYVLNPIYSPYFNITYRKKRKLGLTGEDLQILIHGSFDDASALLKRFSKQWDLEEGTQMTPFFKFSEGASQ